MRRGAAVAASVASGAAASVASTVAWGNHSRLWPPGGGGMRPEHPTPTGSPPVPRRLHDATDHDAVGEHVVIVVVPFADGRLADARLRTKLLTTTRSP